MFQAQDLVGVVEALLSSLDEIGFATKAKSKVDVKRLPQAPLELSPVYLPTAS